MWKYRVIIVFIVCFSVLSDLITIPAEDEAIAYHSEPIQCRYDSQAILDAMAWDNLDSMPSSRCFIPQVFL